MLAHAADLSTDPWRPSGRLLFHPHLRLTKVPETTAQYFRQLDGSREAPDRASDQRSKASAPPGAAYRRCGGLLIPDYMASLERRDTGTPVTLSRPDRAVVIFLSEKLYPFLG